MRVRIRLGPGRTEIIQLESGACLLSDLKRLVEKQCTISRKFELSLNRTDTLDGNCKSLDDLGIVSGDLLYVILDQQEDRLVATSTTVVNKLSNEAVTSNIVGVMNTPTGSCHSASPSVHSKHSSQLALSSHLCELQTELLGTGNAFSPSQVVNQALHAVMRDCGMTHSGVAKAEELSSCNCKHLYVAPLESCTVKATMISHQMGPNGLVIHVGVEMNGLFARSYTTQFSTSPYSNGSSPKVLHQLSRVFKDHIVNQMFNDCRRALGLPESGTFSSLPLEVKLRVMHYLDVRSLLALATVSRDLHSLAQDELIWKDLLSRDFGRAVLLCQESSSWKKAYINLYTTRSRVQEQARASFLIPEGFLPLRPPTWPPDIIGGDYDLHTDLGPPIFPPSLVPRGPLAPHRPLLPLPHPALPPKALFDPTRPLLVGHPSTAHHTRPLLPLPGFPAAPPSYFHSQRPLLPTCPLHGSTSGGPITPMGPTFVPHSHSGRPLLVQPCHYSTGYRHTSGLL